MSRLLAILRLARRDLRHRPGEAAMLVVIVASATTVLTLGLILQGTTAHPYQTTREATGGPTRWRPIFPVPAAPLRTRPHASSWRPWPGRRAWLDTPGPFPWPSRS